MYRLILQVFLKDHRRRYSTANNINCYQIIIFSAKIMFKSFYLTWCSAKADHSSILQESLNMSVYPPPHGTLHIFAIPEFSKVSLVIYPNMMCCKIIIECRAKNNSSFSYNTFGNSCKSAARSAFLKNIFIVVLHYISSLITWRLFDRVKYWADTRTGSTINTFLLIDRRICKAFFIYFHFYTIFRASCRAGRTTTTIYCIRYMNQLYHSCYDLKSVSALSFNAVLK